MGLIHTLIAEVLTHLVNTLEATHDEALQVKLCGNTHVHVLVQGIEVGDEWAGRCTTCDILQDRCVNLGITCFVEDATHGADDGGTLQERIFDTGIHNQVNIALTITQFRIIECVIYLTVSISLHHRQWLQTLAQYGQFHHMNTDFSSLCAEYVSFYTDEITQVKQLLENNVVKVLVLVGADGITLYVYLNTTLRVLQLGKGSLTHDALAHDAACNTYHTAVLRCRRLAYIVAFLIFTDDG